MIVLEFTIDHIIFREALSRAPEMRIEWERTDGIDRTFVQILFWAEGGDFEAFEAGLQDDPTVGTLSHITEVNQRRLYQVSISREGLKKSTYPVLVAENIVIQELTIENGEWYFRSVFPSRLAVDRFYAYCREQGLRFKLQRMFEERTDERTNDYGLSDEQYEILVTAMEYGYFDIPRRNTLSEISNSLGISSAASSQRFRRAMKTLLEHTIYPPADES